MLFQSLPFLIFFTGFFIIYWSFQANITIRNLLIFGASMFIYSLWDFRFTFLLLFVTAVNYFPGRYSSNKNIKGKIVFYICLILNLVPLMFFKYYNFFAESLSGFFYALGFDFNITTLQLLLPVGISFYTFLSVSYLIDVYKKQLEPEKNFLNYAVSVSYFPIIMSGPIHRPRLLLKQLEKKFDFNYDLAVEGLRQILTGLFYKVVIADSIARYADRAFAGYKDLDGLSLLLGSVYFSFQLYFDFNGYSEMAIGVSKLLGIKIERNFRFPYLSRTIADFWKRWHISLTEWFRDYIFLPLSYIVSRKVKPGSVLDKNLFIYTVGIAVTWSLTGFWHGAGWAFILWGMVHAVLLVLNKGFFKKKKKILKKLGIKKDNIAFSVYESLLTFFLVNLSFIFFRSGSAGVSFNIIGKILNISSWQMPSLPVLPLFIGIFVIGLEYIQKDREFLLEISGYKAYLRWPAYVVLTMLVLYFSGNDSAFIYMGF